MRAISTGNPHAGKKEKKKKLDSLMFNYGCNLQHSNKRERERERKEAKRSSTWNCEDYENQTLEETQTETAASSGLNSPNVKVQLK